LLLPKHNRFFVFSYNNSGIGANAAAKRGAVAAGAGF
jgi:hypothetical protein